MNTFEDCGCLRCMFNLNINIMDTSKNNEKTMEHGAHVAKEKMTEAKNTVKEKAAEAKHSTEEAAQKAKDRMKEKMD